MNPRRNFGNIWYALENLSRRSSVLNPTLVGDYALPWLRTGLFRCMNICLVKYLQYKILIKKKKIEKQTMVQICRLENIEQKSMKQVSYIGKYSLSATRAHHSHLQFSFLVGDAFCPHFLHMQVFNYCVSCHHLLVKIFFF